MRKSERSNSADTKANEEGGGGAAPGARAKTSVQPLEKTMVEQVFPLQLVEDCDGAGAHTADHGGSHTTTTCPEGSCSLWRDHARAGFWQDL